MLQKSKSKRIWQLKYLLLVPVIAGMLVYTSCEKEKEQEIVTENSVLNKESIPFTVAYQKPSFKGHENDENASDSFKGALHEHIRKYFRYPEEAQRLGIQGRVYVLFEIGTDGSVSTIKTRGPHKLLTEEAARIIGTLPALSPAMDRNGSPVAVTFSYPIVFRLAQERVFKNDPDSRKVIAAYDASIPSGYITGNVSNNGKGLPGVAIVVKGTTRGAITDYDGNFNIKADKDEELVFQFKGLPNTEIKLRDENNYRVNM